MASQATGLRISDQLTLPLDAITQALVILGQRGAGKTYCTSVLTEEIVKAGHPAVIIDPLGVWWGLRSSASGKRAGLPVVVFGGDHADLPLSETSGKVIAEAIVAGRFPAIIDLSLLSKAASRRFMVDFLETLYHRNREPLMVVVDEADIFAPQRSTPESARLLGAMEDLVRRGRTRGLGVAMATQRPAVLNKDVMSQCSVLVALRVTGKHDNQAIDEWVRLHADENDARELKASLPSLPVGTAWVWSPGWLGILQKVKIRRRNTFDSSATPKVGEARVVPSKLADIDLEALGVQLAQAQQQADDRDPRILQRRLAEQASQITQLTRELEHARRQTPPAQVVERIVEVPVEVRVEVPVLDSDLAALLVAATEQAASTNVLLETIQGHINELVSTTPPALTQPAALAPSVSATQVPTRPAPPAKTPAPAVSHREPAPAVIAPTAAGDSEPMVLGKAQRAILSALAVHGTRHSTQVALLTNYSGKSGGFRNALSSLRTAGYIEGRGDLTATEAGLDALGDFEPLPAGRALIEWWKNTHLGKAERAILDVLVDHYPHPVATDTIAAITGYSATAGGFRNACSRLRSLQLASGRGELTLDPTLDPNGGAH